MEEWKEYKLGDVSTFSQGIQVDIDKQYSDYKPGRVRFIRIVDFTKNGEPQRYIDKPRDKCLTADGDIVMIRYGSQTAGIVAKSYDGAIANNIFKIEFNNDVISNEFGYYYLSQKSIFDYLRGAQSSSTMPAITFEIAGRVPLCLPTINIQNDIVSILKSLDDKIEVNRKINENLEQQAQALFKSWFVDFEPFKNGEFVESELGRIPKGWRVGTFGEIMTIASGKRPPKKESSFSHECNIPLVGASDIMGYTNSVLFNEDILVTGRVGTHGIVQRFNYPCWPSDNTLVLKSDYYEYCYQILCTIDYASLNRGSTQPLITQTDIKNQIILIPPYSVLSDFEKYASTLMKAKENNQRSSRRLAELRDTLLPKLMSGELKVNEIEDVL